MIKFKIARAELHKWEEPVISGKRGSGTIFFSGCNLKCVFCQNYEISHKAKGLLVDGDQLEAIMLMLQDKGANNINLVTPSHYAKPLSKVLEKIKDKALKIPVLYNTSSYESIENLKMLEGLIDIYLPDLKYYDSNLSSKYSGVPDYFEVATKAISEMRRQQPKDVFKYNLMKKGVIVRHLVLPQNIDDSKRVLDFLSKLDSTLYVSLMAQYFPTKNVDKYPELGRRLTASEYEEINDYFFETGLVNGFSQELDSAIEDYVPDFNLQKLQKVLDKKISHKSI